MTALPSSSRDTLRQILVLVATIVTIAFNGISQSLPVGGRTSAEVSNTYSTFFTPANYAFSIWGVIYLLLIGFAVYQALPAQRENVHARKIGWLYLLTCALNCTWIVAFQSNLIPLSFALIVAFLVTLIVIYRRLDVGHAAVSRSDRWLIQLPFSVYLGWLSVATIANGAVLGVALEQTNLLGIAGPTWAAIMLVVATALGAFIVTTRRDLAYVLVFIWAFIAIISKQSATPVVATTALIAVIALIAVSVGRLALGQRGTKLFAG